VVDAVSNGIAEDPDRFLTVIDHIRQDNPATARQVLASLDPLLILLKLPEDTQDHLREILQQSEAVEP
jgi:hypothetical protein